MRNEIQKRALGLAAAQSLSFDGSVGTFYDAYLLLEQAVESETDLPDDVSVWEPLEDWELSDLLDHIESEAKGIERTIIGLLELAEKGLLKASKDSLGIDLTNLSLADMVQSVVNDEED